MAGPGWERKVTEDDELLTPAEVSAITKGEISEAALAQRRYMGLPPVFLKPSPRVVLYRRSAVDAWLHQSEQSSTREGAGVL